MDGPACAEPDELASRLIDPLRAFGRPAAHVRAATFWRDASLRLEHGREDVESYQQWLDADALRREVLESAIQTGSYLPSLRDPETNRSTREPARPVLANQFVLVSGSFLLGRRLPFDRTIHLALSSRARARRTAKEHAWTLPAYDTYDAKVRPIESADLVIKLEDARRPVASSPL